jgi:cellulose synthase/poly-beta-1,6-N-acetylglucosamine synthase-like glycosyltransferase
MKLVFIFSFFALFYIYFGYPFIALLFSVIKPKRINKGHFEPHVTILIAAYNEEKHIELTLKNKLSLSYPKEKLEIIVISDGSTDRTDSIVKTFETAGVALIRQEPRSGKTAALNLGVMKVKGDILVFSDANSIYEPDALKHLLQNFKDPQVGYVTGKMIYVNEDGSTVGDGCSAYMKYENHLRKLETKISSIVGVDGGVDAVRKSLYKTMHPEQLPDFVLPLKVVEQGYRVVYEPMAILRETTLESSKDEYKMRVRVALRALWALRDMKHLLNFKRYGIFSWELFSHKYLRYSAFVFLIGLYIANYSLVIESGQFKAFFILQNAFYAAAIASYFLERFNLRSGILYVPYYFALLNMASAHAFIKYFNGRKQVLWTPRKGG